MTEEIQKDKHSSQVLLLIDRIMDTVDIVVNQVTSGRWILTVIAGICLIHFSWSAKSVDEADKIIDIFKDIVIFYFVVRDVSKPNGGKDEKANATVIPVVDITKPTSQG